MRSTDSAIRTLLRTGIVAAGAALLLLALPAPHLGAQSVGGLGQRPRGGDDNAPRPAPPEPRPDPKPDPKPEPPPAPEPPPTPSPAPEPAPPPPAPAPPQPPPTPEPVAPPAAVAPQQQARPQPPTRPPDTPRETSGTRGREENPDAPAIPPRSVRVTTPIGQRPEPRPREDGDYLYSAPVIIEVPVPVAYPVPVYVPDVPVYTTPPQPFPAVPAPPPPAPLGGNAGPPSPHAPLRLPATTSTAAFADIERAWTSKSLALIRKHVRAGEAIGVFRGGRYAYSLTAQDFLGITRTALGRLVTVSFRFTRLRRATNGDVTAYGKHVYRAPASARPRTGAKAPTRAVKTAYVAYTLRRRRDTWDIVGVDSAPTPLVK